MSENHGVIFMVDAVSAFSEAFAAYKKSIRDFVVYSIAMNIASMILFGILLMLLIVAGVVSLGSINAMFAPGGAGFSFGTLGFGATVIILLIALLIFAWIASGLNGTYMETIAMLMNGKKQTMGAFFKGIPRLATQLLAVGIISGLLIAVPMAVIVALLSLAGETALILGVLIAIAYAILMSLLLTLATPGVILENRSAVSAVKYSLSAAPRHFLGLIIYAVICAIAVLPAIILNVLYIAFFYMPVTTAALLILYKKAK